MAAVVITIALVFFLASFSQIRNIFRKKMPLCRRKKSFNIVGVFGRDHLIDSILQWHNNNNTNKIALVSGAAGSGKTTLAVTLKNCVYDSSSVIIVNKGNTFYKEITDIRKMKDNCIVCFDYVLEALDEIQNYIDQLFMNDSENNKKLSIILLERDATTNILKPIVNSDKYSVLQIQLDEYALAEGALVDIVEYNVKSVVDNDSKNTTITRQEATKIAKMIVEQIDSKFRRPIFAVILATIYRQNQASHFDYSVHSLDVLFSMYWDAVTGFSKFLRKDEIKTEATVNYVKSLQNYVKLVSLLTTITASKIRCCPIGNILEIKLFDSNNDSINNVDLLALIRESLKATLAPDPDLVKWLRFLYQHNYKISKAPEGIYIMPVNLDMFSSWMLYKSIVEDSEQLSKWFSAISQTSNNRYYNETYSYIVRASEIFGYEIYEWFQSISIPKYYNLYQWIQDFAIDIKFILDLKSLHIAHKKMSFFEFRYANFLASMQNPTDIQYVTRYVIDAIEAQSYLSDTIGYQLLRKWSDDRKQELENVGLILK